MANEHITECAERFSLDMNDLDREGPQLEVIQARRLIRLADGMDDVVELLRAMVDQLPNSTDSDRPRAMLAGLLALQNKQLEDLHCLAGGTLLLMHGS